MAIDALVKPLLRLELFQGLRPLQLTEIARRAERVMFKPGSVITTKGQPSDAAILIVSDGAVRTDGPGLEDLGEPIEPGSMLAELAMLIEHEHSSTVVAEGPVRALRINRTDMHEMILDDRRLGDHFVTRIVTRLSKVRDELRRLDGGLSAPTSRDGGEPAHLS